MDIAARYNHLARRMMEHVENGTTDWAEDVMHIPAEEYTDPELWQREMDTLFRKLPVLVGLSHEIPEAGDFKTLDMTGVPLLLTRQRDGSVRVLLNVCTHRAMALVAEERGNKRVFTCPYHAWSFGNDGTLRGIAEAGKFGDVCKAERNLKQFPCHEEGGLIFAVLDPESDLDIRAYLGGMMDDVAAKHFEQWSYVGNRSIQGANWKIALDGYLEGYHFKAAHPETIEPRTFSNIMEFDAHGPHTFIAFPQKNILKLREVPEDTLHEHENDGYDFIRLFFPNVSIFVAPEITQVAQLIPGPTPDRNTTVLHFLHPEMPKDDQESAARAQMADWLRDVVDKEDYQVGLAIQHSVDSGMVGDVIFGRNERGNQFVHRWIRHYRDGNGEGPAPVL